MAKSFKRALSLLLSLMMLAGMCSAGSVTASAADKNYTISLGQTVNVEIEAGKVVWVEFTPAITGSYEFYSSADGDTYCELYSSSNLRLASDDDGGEDNNFSLIYKFDAGVTYKFKVRHYYIDSSSSFDVTLTEAYHTDENFDGKCDMCGQEFKVVLAIDEPVTITLSAGEEKQIVFRCEKDGEYSLSYNSSLGGSWDYDYYIYDSNGNQVGEWYDYLTLTAGEVYTTWVYSNSSSEATITDVCVSHTHKDDNSDGKCDICSAGFSGTIAFGEKKTVAIPADDMRELRYTCQATGFYTFDYDSDTNGYDYSQVLDPDGDYVGEMYDDIYFVSGKTYRLQIFSYDETEVKDITLVKNHTDNNGDGKCDGCSVENCAEEFSGAIAYGESKDLEIPAGEIRELVFNCEKSGMYRLSYSTSTAGYDDCTIFSSTGKYKGGIYDSFVAAAGEKIIIRLSAYESSDTVIYGLKLGDEHYDGDGDGKCDVCGLEFSATIALGEKKDVTVPEGEKREFVFKCEKDGTYWFSYNSASGANSHTEAALDSEGKSLGYFGMDNKLEAGKSYLLRFGALSGNLTVSGVYVGHYHIDSDGDDKCDICSNEYRVTITLGEPRTFNIAPGEYKEIVFKCEKSGEYWFNCDDYSSDSWDYEGVYDSSGNYVGDFYDSLTLTAGETYSALIYAYSSATSPVKFYDVYVGHEHADENSDGKCVICSEEYRSTIALGEKKTVEIPAGSSRELVFNCEKDGDYWATYNSSTGGSWSGYIYDANGFYLGDFNSTVSFTAGQTVIIRVNAESSDVKIKDLFIDHDHTDDNSDNKCDICGLQLVYDLILDTPVTVFVPSREYRVSARINVAEDGYYNLVLSNDFRNFSYSVYDSNDDYVSGEPYYFESGETYTVWFSNYESKDVTGTVTLAHIHSFDPASDKCSICGKQIVFTAEEDKPAAVTVDPLNIAAVKFTPVKDGDYSMDYDSEYTGITEVTDSSGNSVPYGFDDFNGAIFTLTAGETYFFNMYNDDNAAETFDATVRHTHDGTVTTIVEPTIASSGLDKLTCDSCGESVYALTDCTGSDVTSGTTEDGFWYEVYEKDGEYEAVIYGYIGEETEVVIPAEIEAYGMKDPVPVTVVRSSDDIRMNNTITSVTIPEGIREIGYGAFAGYTALEEIVIPESVLIIGDDAFSGCVNLEGVTLGSNVKYIGENAFATTPDEEDREYFESDLADIEDYISNEIEEYEDDIKEEEEARESYFASLSSISGVPVNSWDDVKTAIEAADLDDLNNFIPYISFADKEEAEAFLYDFAKDYFEREIDYYNSQIRAAESFLEACNEIINADDTPLAWVIYNGSEEDFGKIIIKKNNEELTEARTGFDGKDPEFTITYDANGGENAPEAQTGFKDVTLSADEPEYYGYTFLGWATDTDAAEAVYAAGDDYYLIADATFYAVWEEKVMTLTYDANGGKNAPEAQQGYGAISLSADEPENYGYTFLGWAKTKDATAAEYAAGAEYTLEEDTTLYAVWEEIIVTMTYDANGGENAPAAQKGYGKIALAKSEPSRDGYEFLGWAKTKDAKAAEYAAGANYTLEEDTTLYAVWQKLYTLTYDANGGKDAPAAQKGNGEITLSSAKPARGGYEFLGWAKTKDATKADYAAGAKLNLTADTTVYAVWKATFKLPEFSAKSASYNTYVTVNVNLNNVPAGAEVYIDGKKADANGSTYSADIGQVKATKDVKIEVKQGGEVLDSSTLTVKVDSGFFAKLISFFTNFLFNLFSWKKVTVTF